MSKRLNPSLEVLLTKSYRTYQDSNFLHKKCKETSFKSLTLHVTDWSNFLPIAGGVGDLKKAGGTPSWGKVEIKLGVESRYKLWILIELCSKGLFLAAYISSAIFY